MAILRPAVCAGVRAMGVLSAVGGLVYALTGAHAQSPTQSPAKSSANPWKTQAAQSGSSAAGDARVRYDRLYRRMQENPRDLDLMFEFAQLAARVGEPEQAITTYERMLLVNPDLPRVKLELGALYYRIGSTQAARGYFEQVAARSDLPNPVRRRVRAYLAQIDDAQGRHDFRFATSAGVRYQTNATAAPDDEAVVTPFGVATLTEDFQDQPDWSLFAAQDIRHRYDLRTGLGESWETTMLGYLSRYQELPRLDLDVVEATTGPRLAVLPRRLDGTLRPHLRATHVRRGRDAYYTSYGFGVSGDVLLGQRAQVTANYTGSYQAFATPDTRPNANDSDGVEHEVEVTGNYALTPDLTLLVGVAGGRLAAEAGFESYNEGRLRTGADYSYRPPVVDTGVPWRLSLRVTRSWTVYDDPDPLVAPGRTRREDRWQLSLSNTARITDNLSFDLQISVTDTGSNIRNYEYRNTAFLAGVTVNY